MSGARGAAIRRLLLGEQKGYDMKPIHTRTAPSPIGPFSQAVLSGEFLFVSGQGPVGVHTGEAHLASFEEQTRQVFRNIEAILIAADLALRDIVKVNIYLSNIDDYQVLNSVYSSFFDSPYPARTTVQAVLPFDIAIEVDVIARVPG